MIDDERITNAIKRIALTPDGDALSEYLERTLMEVCANPTIPGALPHHEGRRSFAHDLKKLMDESISETNSGDRTGNPTARRLVFLARPAGLDVRSPGGARRRVPDIAG